MGGQFIEPLDSAGSLPLLLLFSLNISACLLFF